MTQSPAEVSDGLDLLSGRMLRMLGFGMVCWPTSTPAGQLCPGGSVMGKPSSLLCSRLKVQPLLPLSCGGSVPTMNLAFPSITLSATQERVSCYTLSDTFICSTVPIFFQHLDFDFFFLLIQMKQSELNSLAPTVTTNSPAT